MRYRKKLLRVLGLPVLMALALTVLAGPTAQAQGKLSGANAPAFFTINGGQVLLTTVTLASEGFSAFLFPGQNLTVKCESIHAEEGKLSTSTEAPFKLLYLGCLSYNYKTGTHVGGCTITNGKTIAVSTVLKPVAHGEGYYLLADSITVPIQFHKELGCPLSSFEAKGSLAAEVTQLEAVKQLITFSEAVQSLLGDTLKAGTFAAYFDASVLLELWGEHMGEKLGVHQPKDLDLPKASSTLGAFTVAGSEPLAGEERSVAVQQESLWRLSVPSQGVDIKCKKLEAGTFIANSAEAYGLGFFRGCAAFESGTEKLIENCVIPNGNIFVQGLLLPVLHNGETYVLIEPAEGLGERLATVVFKSGLGCALPLINKVEGTTAVRIDELELVKLPFATDEEIQLLAGGLLTFAGSAAYPEASSEAWLDDSHEGLALGVH